MKMTTVIWRDASGLGTTSANEWFDVEELKKLAQEQFNDLAETVGFIVEKNKDFVVICGTKTGKDSIYCDCTMIPNEFIIKTK